MRYKRPMVCAVADDKSIYPNDEAATKLIYLVLCEVSKGWTMAARDWSAARTQFLLLFGERFSAALY